MVMSYATNLLDPRWQTKKAEIILRDHGTCQLCGDNTATLHVHHRIYIKGKQPWEYDNSQLITLCESCHMAINALIDYQSLSSIQISIADAHVGIEYSRTEWRRQYFKMLLDKYTLAREFILSSCL